MVKIRIKMLGSIQKISINNDMYYIYECILKDTCAFRYLFDTSAPLIYIENV